MSAFLSIHRNKGGFRGECSLDSNLDAEIQAWKRYRHALSGSDSVAFDQLMNLVELNKAVANYAETVVPFDPMLMSILLGQQKQIQTLQRKIDALLVATLKQG
jgi:hypothetical protein